MRSNLRVAIAATLVVASVPTFADAVRPTAFAICTVCHAVVAGQLAKIGPNLVGVVGRAAGTAPGFTYSEAMKKSAIMWNDDNLSAFISAPASKIPGTKMNYPGQKDPALTAQIVAYLATLK